MAIEDEEEAIEFGRSAAREGQSGGGQPMKGMGASAKEMKERKKSLMTRLIPGRNGPNGWLSSYMGSYKKLGWFC